MASGSGCKEVYRFFLILLIPTPLVSVLLVAASLLFVHLKKCFSFLFLYLFVVYVIFCAI